MKKIAFAFLCSMAVLSFAGCKKKGGGDAAVAKANEFKEKACKCKPNEKDCADKVMKEMMDYGDKNKAEAEKWAKDTALMAKVKPISEATQKCLEAAMGTGATDPGSAAGSADPGSAAGSADPGSAAGSAAGSADPGSAAGSAAAGSADGSAAAGSAAPAPTK